VTFILASDEVARVVGELSGDLEVVVRVDKNKGSGRNAELRRPYTDKKSGGSCLPPLVNPRHNHQAPWLSYEGLSPAALLIAALLAAATLLTATAPLASATLLLALALLAFTFLFIPIFLLATTALLSATALLAALLSSAFRFHGFIRIALCFHSIFLSFLISVRRSLV